MVPEFKGSPRFTIGVELEFQLIDPRDFELVSSAPSLLEHSPKSLKGRLKKEFIESMLELTTGVCEDMEQVEQELSSGIQTLEYAAKESGCLIHASSLHPFSDPLAQRITRDPRYKEILEDLQLVGRMLITQGLHVHIGVPDGDTAVMVVDHIRNFLPLVLALSASSPYFQKIDTGFQSYRSKLFEALPRSGVPAAIGTWKDFKRLVQMLMTSRVISDVRDIWWDVRPHPYFGTVEVRIADLPTTFKEILAVAALVQALVVHLAQEQPKERPIHRLIIANNKWQALRYGLDGSFIWGKDGTRFPFSSAVKALLGQLKQVIVALGTNRYIDIVEWIIENGSPSQRERQMHQAGIAFKDIILREIEDFWQ